MMLTSLGHSESMFIDMIYYQNESENIANDQGIKYHSLRLMISCEKK